MSQDSRPSECLQCPQCASPVVRPVLPTTDTIEMRCAKCGTVWAVPLPTRANRVARFTLARFNIWRSALERRRHPR